MMQDDEEKRIITQDDPQERQEELSPVTPSSRKIRGKNELWQMGLKMKIKSNVNNDKIHISEANINNNILVREDPPKFREEKYLKNKNINYNNEDHRVILTCDNETSHEEGEATVEDDEEPTTSRENLKIINKINTYNNNYNLHNINNNNYKDTHTFDNTNNNTT